MRLTHVLAVGILSGMMFAPHGMGQTYPNKAVRVIVPSAAGGNPDFIVRPSCRK